MNSDRADFVTCGFARSGCVLGVFGLGLRKPVQLTTTAADHQGPREIPDANSAELVCESVKINVGLDASTCILIATIWSKAA